MENNIEQVFFLGDKKCAVIKSNTPLQKTYSLSESQGFPWLTYLGADGVAGSGIMSPPGYSKPDSMGRCFLFSVSPWWVDANHSYPGYGSLHLIFLANLRPVHPTIKGIPFDSSLVHPNMRDMKLRGKIRGHGVDFKGADLVFWFQCYSEKISRSVNYALVGQPLNDKLIDGKINDFEVNVDIGKSEDWVCLGSCDQKSDLYGYLEINDLDLDMPSSMGFILVPVDTKPLWPNECNAVTTIDLGLNNKWPIDPRLLPTGCIALYDLVIDYYTYYDIKQLR